MDYEKKYKEALETARLLYTYSGTDEEFKKGLLKTFPELRESEDERIRKELIKEVQFINPEQDECDEDGKELPCYHERIAKYIAYLEKQKEQNIYKSSKSEIDFAERYSKDVWEKLMSKFKVVEGYSIGCNDVSDIVLNAILNAFKWQKEQQPAEWSEEDEELAEELIKLAEYYTDTEDETEFKPHISWLKRLHERFNLQPKQEWSEEDKDYFRDVKCAVYDYFDEGYAEELCDWLRPHWKPSKKQMEALDNAQGALCSTEYNKGLCSLIDDLKKL